jgi:hypothetical protein
LLQPHAEFEAEVCGKHSRPSGLTSTGCALCPRTMRTRICITARRGSSAYREQHARHPGSMPCPLSIGLHAGPARPPAALAAWFGA